MRGSVISFLLTCGYMILAAWLTGFLYFSWIVRTITVPRITGKTDADVVLTGGANRIETGLDLLKSGATQKLFISGVNDDVTLDQLISRWGGNLDDPSRHVFLGYKARNTSQNASEVREWTRSQRIKTMRLVTSNYHMPRAWVEMRHAMPNIFIFRYPVVAGPEEYRINGGAVRLIFEEYNKTIFTWVRLNFFAG